MSKTLLARISKLEQYNSTNQTILWEDPTPSRWVNIYSQLQAGDNTLFIAADKLLIGTVSQLNTGQSVLCTGIQEVRCSNDQLLQLHEIYPEHISRVKANFQPFLHPLQVNIDQLIADAIARNFVSFYILSGIEKYHQSIGIFRVNDRITLLDKEGRFENVKLHSDQGLVSFPQPIEVNISVERLTLGEMLDKNKSIKRKSTKSNNVSRIENISRVINESGLYKFKTFFSYYDCLYNKLVYNAPGSNSTSLITIPLQTAETVFKVSMSGKDINEEAFTYFNENNLIIVHGETKAKGTSYQSQGDTFTRQMKTGDYFYLCRGNSNFEVVGRITSDATGCEYGDFGDDGWLQRSYETVTEAQNENPYEGDKKWWTPNDNSTCIAIPKHEVSDANNKIFIPFFNMQFTQEGTITPTTEMPGIMDKIHNQILYGPPGTGKTYNTINRALEIVGESVEGKTRQQVKELFDAKVKEGQIVFTTFHQSMSYEDFIEGIKPQEPEKEGAAVTYLVEPGIFKKLCIEAAFSIAQLGETKATEKVLDFSILYDSLAESVEEKLTKGETVTLPAKGGGSVLVEEISQHGNFIIRHHDGSRTYTVSKARLSKLNAAIKNLDDISNIHNQFREIIGGSNSSAYWSVLNAVINHLASETPKKEFRTYSTEEKTEVVASLSKDDYKNNNGKPHVLIIDEINRGNVSQIFGELITLIEEDKRLGQPEALELTLPYSKEKFGVPPNLYIIGTMNTADRSVEALDAALRRRFIFEEMPPQPDLITSSETLRRFWLNNIGVYGGSREEYDEYEEGIRSLLGINVVDYNAYIALGESDPISDKEEFSKKLAGLVSFNGIDLSMLLTFINKRIEKLLDKDHQIGHSYLMSVDSMEKLQNAFYNKIIPLLQEYFFGSYDKIGLVLGDGFVRLKEAEQHIFADFDSESAADFEERPVYEIVDYRKDSHGHRLTINKQDIDMTFEKAIRRLMKQDIG